MGTNVSKQSAPPSSWQKSGKEFFLIVEYQLLRKNSSKELVSESELSI
jgi:hypothetical protein